MVRLCGTIAVISLISPALANDAAVVDPTPQAALVRAPFIGPV